MDVEAARALVDAVDRAFVDTGPVLDIHTRLRDHIRHAFYRLSSSHAEPLARSAFLTPVSRVWSHHSELRTGRSEEHTSELQSRGHLVCRLLLEKKSERPEAR